MKYIIIIISEFITVLLSPRESFVMMKISTLKILINFNVFEVLKSEKVFLKKCMSVCIEYVCMRVFKILFSLRGGGIKANLK